MIVPYLPLNKYSIKDLCEFCCWKELKLRENDDGCCCCSCSTGIHWHDISSLSIICLLLKMNFHLSAIHSLEWEWERNVRLINGHNIPLSLLLLMMMMMKNTEVEFWNRGDSNNKWRKIEPNEWRTKNNWIRTLF